MSLQRANTVKIKEVNTSAGWKYASCPSCKCTINWDGSKNDIEDIIPVYDFVTVEDWDDDLDGYLAWEVQYALMFIEGVHNCGCRCTWSFNTTQHAEEYREQLKLEIFGNSWVEDEEVVYECTGCGNQYDSTKVAQDCCTETPLNVAELARQVMRGE